MRRLFCFRFCFSVETGPLLPPQVSRDLKSVHANGDGKMTKQCATPASHMCKPHLPSRSDVAGAAVLATPASAQIPLPVVEAAGWRRAVQAANARTCHTNNLTDPRPPGTDACSTSSGRRGRHGRGLPLFGGLRQGPISSGTKRRSTAWMTNPQEVIPDAVMAYRQAKPEVRTAIIAYLKELH